MSSSPPNGHQVEVTDRANSEDLHVVTENGEQCFMWRANQLTYIAQDRHELPLILATKFGRLATKLDLSYNSLTSFRNVNLFTNLNELILDNNNLDDDSLEFRQNLRLKTLSLNKNKLVDLFRLINSIKKCYPNLEFLSLIGNPLCPGPLLSSPKIESHTEGSSETETSTTGNLKSDTTATVMNGGIHGIDELILSTGQDDEHSTACLRRNLSLSDFSQQKYRHFIIYHLPNLRFLDSSPIRASERDEALRRCFWMNRATSLHVGESHHRVEMATQATQLDFPHLEDQATAHRENSYVHSSTIVMADKREQSKGAFSRLAYKYTGKNSEGNRFIRNNDL